MKMFKKLIIILIVAFSMIILHSSFSNAATSDGLPKDGQELYSWLVDTKKVQNYFNMDPGKFLSKYKSAGSFKNTDALNSDSFCIDRAQGTDRGYWMCIGDTQDVGKQGGWLVTNIIDFDSQGNVTVHSSSGPNSVTKSDHRKKMSTLGYLLSNTGRDNAAYDEAYGYWTRLEKRYGLLSKYGVKTGYYRFYTNISDGAYPGFPSMLDELFANPREGLQGYTQIRVMVVSGAGWQDRLIVGKTRVPSTRIKIIKKDLDGNKVKPSGGNYRIYYKEDEKYKLIEKDIKLKKGEFITTKNLKPGKYKIEEVEAPTGYALPEKKADRIKEDVEVKSGKTKEVEFKDPKVPWVEVIKVDEADTNEKLIGFKFGLYELDEAGKKTVGDPILVSTASRKDKNGNYVPATITQSSINKLLKSGKLKIGKEYGFKEVKVPAGYAKSDKVVVKKLENGRIKFTMKNKKIPTIEIIKVDKNNKKLKLGGAIFKIYADEALTQLVGTTKPTSDKTGSVVLNKWQTEDRQFKEGETYWIQEVQAPPGYEIDEKNVREVGPLKVGLNTVTFENEPTNPQIQIIKKDSKTGKLLDGAVFTIYDSSGKAVASGTTGKNGTLLVENLKMNQTYTVEETMAPNGYEIDTKTQTVTLTESLTIVEFTDTKKPGPPQDNVLKIIEGTDEPMEGVRFGLKNWDPDNDEYEEFQEWVDPPNSNDDKYYYWRDHGYYSHANCEYDEKGNHICHKEWVSDWRRHFDSSKYNADMNAWKQWKAWYDDWKENYEYYLKSKSQYVEFGTTDKDGYVTFSTRAGTYDMYEIYNPNTYFDDKEKLVHSGYRGGDKFVIENKRKYIDLEGVAFIDESTQKSCVKNDLYDAGEEISDIKVTLKRGESVVSTTKTGKDGKYFFSGDRNNLKIETEYLSSYSIEFEYNGMKFEAVTPNPGNKEKGSKADDIVTQRDALNSKYSTITNQSDVEYYTNKYESKIKYTPESLAYRQWVDSRYQISATTNGVYDLGAVYAGQSKSLNTISHINFGIAQRDQPDLALTEDLDRLEITLNGATYNFKYGQRTEEVLKSLEIKNDNGIEDNNEEKFTGDYSQMSYTRAIFPSDISKGGLEVRAVYKIGINNQSTTRDTRINEIEFYYSDGYEIGTTETELSKKYSEENGNYKVSNIATNGQQATVQLNNAVSQEQTRGCIYVVVKVKDDTVNSLLDEGDNKMELNSHAEIASYTTLDGAKEIAGVDVDSKPGSVDIEDISTYEDDTDRAPGFNLVLQADRSISGKIFIDMDKTGKDEYTLYSGQDRIGNGIYDEGESPFTNVEIRLIEDDENGNSTGNVAKRYLGLGVEPVDAIIRPDDEGNYTIDGILPGKYHLEYIWGDANYLAENYKGTIVDNNIHTQKQSNPYWYSANFRSSVEGGNRWSDAIDDERLRNEIDKNSNEMIYNSLTKVKEGNSKMTSFTPSFNLNYEYEHNKEDNNKDGYEYDYVDQEVEYEIETGTFRDQWNVLIKKNSYENKIPEVDFGIVRRPKQELELIKEVERVKITLANGQVLVDAEIIEENGQKVIKDNAKYVTYIPNYVINSATIKIETNSEIIQSATLEIFYKFTINNISEIDYIDKDYYYYGINGKSYVTLTPNEIVDYLNTEKCVVNPGWDLLREEDLQKLLDERIKRENWEDVKSMAQVLKNGPENQVNPLKPKESATLGMLVSKLMSPNDEIDIGNQAELIKTTKNGGAIVESTHGNYNPIKYSRSENDDSKAEDVILIPPTGNNKNYVIPIVIGITAVAILGAGVVLIKKYVLK